MISRAWYDIQGRKYIDIDHVQFKVPFRYGRVLGCEVQGHVPIQDMPVGTQVKYTTKKVIWDGLEYLILQSICPIPGTEKP